MSSRYFIDQSQTDRHTRADGARRTACCLHGRSFAPSALLASASAQSHPGSVDSRLESPGPVAHTYRHGQLPPWTISLSDPPFLFPQYPPPVKMGLPSWLLSKHLLPWGRFAFLTLTPRFLPKFSCQETPVIHRTGLPC
jgi:hypothetical protein